MPDKEKKEPESRFSRARKFMSTPMTDFPSRFGQGLSEVVLDPRSDYTKQWFLVPRAALSGMIRGAGDELSAASSPNEMINRGMPMLRAAKIMRYADDLVRNSAIGKNIGKVLDPGDFEYKRLMEKFGGLRKDVPIAPAKAPNPNIIQTDKLAPHYQESLRKRKDRPSNESIIADIVRSQREE